MKITDLWNVSALLDKIWKARMNLQQCPQECFVHKAGNQACMVDIIAPPSYHQTREIAEAFGLDYDELLMNEKEMEVFRRLLLARTEELLTDLNQRILTPQGYSFSFGYDPGGNFGLLLHQSLPSGKEEEKRKNNFFLPMFLASPETPGSRG